MNANEFEKTGSCSNNYVEHKEVMSNLSIVDVCRAVDLINAMSNMISTNNEIQDNVEPVLEPLYNVIVKLRTDTECPHCGSMLYKSDLPQYNLVCPSCDENF